MQKRVEESRGHAEGDWKNIRSPASEPVGRDGNILANSHATHTVCACLSQCESLFVCKHTRMSVWMKGVELVPLEPQLVQPSLKKGSKGMKRKEWVVWEKDEGGLDKEIPVPIDGPFGTMEEERGRSWEDKEAGLRPEHRRSYWE